MTNKMLMRSLVWMLKRVMKLLSGSKSTWLVRERAGVMGALGGFGGMFDLSKAGVKEPVLISGTDGVGTKLMLAIKYDKHDTIGQDCVAMCVNDIIAAGAGAPYFLDYVATGKNEPAKLEQVVAGVAEGCVQAGAALIGGETAEMPGMYGEDDYDLAGFAVGVAEKSQIVDGSKVAEGDVLLGLALKWDSLKWLLPRSSCFCGLHR